MPTITPQQSPAQSAAIAPVKAPEIAAVPEPAKETKPEPEKLSPQFAALARKEKALRLEAQRIKLEREEIKAEKEKFKGSEYVPKERITKETLAVLSEAGLSHDQVAQMLLNGQMPQAQDPTIAKLMARIEELEGKHTKVETEIKDNQSKAYDQAVNQIRNDAKILIDSDPAYETIKARNRVESVVKYIQQTFEQDGVLLSVEDAAKEVEDALVEEAMQLMGLSKIKARLQPEVPQQQASKQQSQQVRTLTHDLSAAPSKQTLSAKDRYQRAILRAKGFDPDTGKPIAG